MQRVRSTAAPTRRRGSLCTCISGHRACHRCAEMDMLAMPYDEQRDSRIGLEGLSEVTEQAKNSLESPPAFAGRLTDNSQCHTRTLIPVRSALALSKKRKMRTIRLKLISMVL